MSSVLLPLMISNLKFEHSVAPRAAAGAGERIGALSVIKERKLPKLSTCESSSCFKVTIHDPDFWYFLDLSMFPGHPRGPLSFPLTGYIYRLWIIIMTTSCDMSAVAMQCHRWATLASMSNLSTSNTTFSAS